MRQISAAASPVAAIDVCAAAPTRNEDGSPGSAPVSVTRSRAAGSPPAADHRSARICAGGVLSVGLMLMRDRIARGTADVSSRAWLPSEFAQTAMTGRQPAQSSAMMPAPRKPPSTATISPVM